MKPLLLTLLLGTWLAAQDQNPFDDPDVLGLGNFKRSTELKVDLLTESKTVAAGKPFTVGIRLQHPAGYHSYWENPGTGNLPLRITWELPEGFNAGPTQWPIPHKKAHGERFSFTYEGEVLFLSEITPPATFSAGQEAVLKLSVGYQICEKERCLPPKTTTAEITLKAEAEAEIEATTQAEFDKIRQVQPATLPDWKVEVKSDKTATTITLTPSADANPDPGELFFFDRLGFADSKPPTVAREGNVFTLTIPTVQKDDLKSDGVDGFVTASKGWKKDGSTPALRVTSNPTETAATAARPASSASTEKTAEIFIPDPSLEQAGEAFQTEDVSDLNFWSAALFAFLGGMILNLMPCVFPVLGLKVLGFVKLGGQDNKKVLMHGIVFSLGLLLFVWVLAGIMIYFKQQGESQQWGFQMRNPTFVAFIVALLFLMSLWLAGVFEMGGKLTQLGGAASGKKGYFGSFFSGVLTTLVATPCSGPFLGAAMGFALQQNTLGILLLFTCFGLGIAAPYLLLSASPPLIKRLPKPGEWMETFKKILVFPLLGFVVFFLNGFGAIAGRVSMSWLLFALVVLGCAAFVYGHWCPPFRSGKSRLFGGLAALLLLGYGVVVIRNSVRNAKPEIVQDGFWKEWSPQLVQDLRHQGKIIFVDFTTPG